jgi:hypothetical protein
MRSSLVMFSVLFLVAASSTARAQTPPPTFDTAPPVTPTPLPVEVPPPAGAAPAAASPAPFAPPQTTPSTDAIVTPAASANATKATAADFTTLRLMRAKGIITQAEYDSALRDLGETSGLRAAEANTFVLGKWSTTLYGFVEADNIFDTTRSFNETAGNGQVQRHGAIPGDSGRFMMSIRNSRIGFRLRAPESHGVRVSSMLEMDFLGTQLPSGNGQPYYGSEGAYFTNPTFRARHLNLKIETPVVDILVGQYWQLFGWQSAYQPNTVEIQGVPGEVYSRTPQIRISKTFKTDPVTFEAAIAATRPVSRDTALPDGQAGLRLAVNGWTGTQTVGSTGSTIAPLSIAVTGYLRNFSVDEFLAKPLYTKDKLAGGVAVDAFIPVLPGTKEHKDNSLSINGEFASGTGGADFYTGLSGGVAYPALPNPTNATPAPAYTSNIDSGLVTFGADGALHPIQWTSYLVGLQYYLPELDGRMWISANYSHMASSNIGKFGSAPAKTRLGEDWFDVNLFGDVTSSVRLGLEYAYFDDQYQDGKHARNHRAQGSFFFLF